MNLDRYISEDDLTGMVVPAKDFDCSQIKYHFLDVHYGCLPEQKLDIYLPDQVDGPFPLLIYVHGGGWMIGTKRLCFMDCIIDAIKYGYAVISMDYRLAPAVRFPEFLYDVKTAIRWARAHAGDYGFDPEHIGLVGDSAGGNLSLLAAFTAGEPELEGERYGWPNFSSAVQAVCAMYAPSVLYGDDMAWFRESGISSRTVPMAEGEENLYETVFGTKNVEMLKLLSPINLVHENIPPVLLQHGKRDSVVPCQHSVLLAERIEGICGPGRMELRLYPDRDHGDRQFIGEENCREVLTFFDRYLK